MGFKSTCITLAIGGAIGVTTLTGYQVYKEMKVEASFKETIKNIDESTNNISIIVDTLKSEMNGYLSYPVSYSSATFKNFNEYKEGKEYVKNIFTGEVVKNPFKKNEDWVIADPTVWTYAQAEAKFTHNADLSKLEYAMDGNTIYAKASSDLLFLDEDSVSLDMKTYKECEPEEIDGKMYKNDMNKDAAVLDMKQNMDKKTSSIKANALRAWEVKFIEDAPEKINELYNTDEERKLELKENSKASIEKLLNSVLIDTMKKLGYVDENINLIVEIDM